MSRLTSVVISDSVTSIGEEAFSFSSSLADVTIPDSVEHIGEKAFYNCNGLKKIVISDKVTEIEPYMFYGCISLETVILPKNLQTIGKCAFFSCPLESITIPETVTSIGTSAFCYTSLIGVVIPDSVTQIDNYAFQNCVKLESITLPENITAIPNGMLFDCTTLENITVPENVASIGGNAFYNCTSMTDVYCYPDPAYLSWDDSDCDDFKEGGSTQIHVRKNWLDAYNDKFGETVNATFVGDLPSLISESTVSIASLAYDGTEKTPVIKCGDTVLTSADYDVLEGETTASAVGKYSITIKGKGDYEGTATLEWEIIRGNYTPTVSIESWIYFEIKVGTSTKKVKVDKLVKTDEGYQANYTLKGVLKKYFGKEITITPYWTTLDGKTVTGTATTYTIQ